MEEHQLKALYDLVQMLNAQYPTLESADLVIESVTIKVTDADIVIELLRTEEGGLYLNV